MKPMILSKRFEVTIPKQVRNSLKLRVGQKLQIKSIDSRMILIPQEASASFTKMTRDF
jgi:AbrB family looped-hinge helix DNA binding protein